MNGPQHNRACMVVLSDNETLRVRKFIAKAGTVNAARLALGVSVDTLAAAREFGRMDRKTREKLLERLT